MDRRSFLAKTSALSLAGLLGLNLQPKLARAAGTFAADAYNDKIVQGGWLNAPEVTRYFVKNTKNPYLSQVNSEIRGTGAGKMLALWPYLEQVTGRPLLPHLQEIGDCVGHSFGLGIDILTSIQIIMRKSPQRWVAEAATEIIYGGGRVEIGTQEYGKRWRGDGVNGTAVAEFIKRYGVLIRQRYGIWDFTNYSGDVARQLGRSGVPDELEPICRIHPVGCVTLVRSWEEARDCIYNGYPVTLSSSQGFNTRYGRDKDGFLPPSRRPWMHSMLLAGMDDNPKRPGGLIINSWGSTWIKGPTRHNQPDGSFWADAAVIDRICKQGDSVALSCYAGYPRQDYSLW